MNEVKRGEVRMSRSSSPQASCTEGDGCQFAAHAQVLSSDSGNGGRDEVCDPPGPGVGETSVAQAHEEEQKKQCHCEI